MQNSLNRRHFIKTVSTAGAGVLTAAALPRARAPESPNSKILVAVMGTNSRGMDHIAGYLAQPNCEIAYICDVDRRALEKGIAAVSKKQQRAPKGVADIRKVLDDRDVDAISIATPNHWHAPAAIL